MKFELKWKIFILENTLEYVAWQFASKFPVQYVKNTEVQPSILHNVNCVYLSISFHKHKTRQVFRKIIIPDNIWVAKHELFIAKLQNVNITGRKKLARLVGSIMYGNW